ncbi:hypothetical protein [Roseateles noduli]|uniref:hypothetical protein n=1 Tax=Roseateles noduli TaxID=2052484 RepID=UPI003D65B45E
MSILNAQCCGAECIIEVDTLGGVAPGMLPDGLMAEQVLVPVPKVCVVAHQSLMAASRGTTLFFCLLSQALQVSPLRADELLDHAQDLLTELYHGQFLRHPLSAQGGMREVSNDGVIACFSPRLQRMRVLSFCTRGPSEPVEVNWLSEGGRRDVHITPWFDELEPFERAALAGRSIEAMPAVQLRLVAERHPEMMTGGDIVTVRLSMDEIRVTKRPQPSWR